MVGFFVFMYTAILYFYRLVTQVEKLELSQIDWRQFLGLAALTECALFQMAIALLFLIRKPSLAKTGGWKPKLFTLLGAFLFVWVSFPSPIEPGWLQSLMGLLLLSTGTAVALYALSVLRGSFSLLPEARALVREGPYAHIRHPLYLAEGIATVGWVILNLNVYNVALFILFVTSQVIRMHYEEGILLKAFPEYLEYARQKPRLIPGIY